MKNNYVSQAKCTSEHGGQSSIGRFQVYRESRGGNSAPGFRTDSDSEAIESFVFQVPADEGGDIRILDQTDQRMIGLVKWKVARTEIGLPIRRRVTYLEMLT